MMVKPRPSESKLPSWQVNNEICRKLRIVFNEPRSDYPIDELCRRLSIARMFITSRAGRRRLRTDPTRRAGCGTESVRISISRSSAGAGPISRPPSTISLALHCYLQAVHDEARREMRRMCRRQTLRLHDRAVPERHLSRTRPPEPSVV